MDIRRRVAVSLLAGAAVGFAASPALAYKESLQPNGQRFELLSELSSIGEDRPLFLQTCGVGGPNQVEAKTIRQYYDRNANVHLWIITTPARRDILFYSTNGFACTVVQR